MFIIIYEYDINELFYNKFEFIDVEIIEEDKDNVGNESMFKLFSGSEEVKRLE